MKAGVKRYYEKRARTYEDLDEPDSIVSYVRAVGITDHLGLMNLKEGERVLDVGCGNGRFLKKFQSGAINFGLDFTIEMLLKAKDGRAFLIRGDAEHLPLKKNVFDVVHSAGLLGVYKSSEIIKEMGRVAKAGGRIYVSYPALWSVSGVVAWIFMRFGWNPTLLDYWYTEKEIKSMFLSGLNVKQIRRMGFEPPFQRLYKKFRSKKVVRIFGFLEKELRDKPVFRYFGARFLVKALKSSKET